MDLSIKKVLTDLGVLSSDIIVIHGDAGAAFQLTDVDIKDRINFLITLLIDFIGDEGTLVIPTFSYSITKNEDFNVNETPSDIGAFSEAFRVYPGALRSKNPNFSFSSIGKNAIEFSDARLDDCFGQGTAFDLMHKHNAKLICLGCDFSRITFVHYLEQKVGVSYRYLKSFKGAIIDSDEIQNITNTYYVRDLTIDSQGELSAVKERSIKKDLLRMTNFGRFPVTSIKSRDFYSIAEELLSEDPYALTQHRLNLK